jgi:hypothetical protein
VGPFGWTYEYETDNQKDDSKPEIPILSRDIKEPLPKLKKWTFIQTMAVFLSLGVVSFAVGLISGDFNSSNIDLSAKIVFGLFLLMGLCAWFTRAK